MTQAYAAFRIKKKTLIIRASMMKEGNRNRQAFPLYVKIPFCYKTDNTAHMAKLTLSLFFEMLLNAGFWLVQFMV
jgi:hypothetical protein